jgi:hypothetical protein
LIDDHIVSCARVQASSQPYRNAARSWHVPGHCGRMGRLIPLRTVVVPRSDLQNGVGSQWGRHGECGRWAQPNRTSRPTTRLTLDRYAPEERHVAARSAIPSRARVNGPNVVQVRLKCRRHHPRGCRDLNMDARVRPNGPDPMLARLPIDPEYASCPRVGVEVARMGRIQSGGKGQPGV